MMSDHAITRLTVRAKHVDRSLWHRPNEEISLGCTRCPELKFCGGLSIRAPAFDCLSLCCDSPNTCKKYVCPKQPRFSALVNEAGGFPLAPYRRTVAPMGSLPDYVPYIFDVGNIVGPLPLRTFAISLYDVIDHRGGIARFSSREEMLQRFKIDSEAHVVITATDKDRRVENFWHILRSKKTAESIRRLRPSLIATPNFSMHTDTVRHDNLLSMSRNVYCFEAFAAAGLPVAVHVNGRTPFDFRRWAAYLNESPSIYAVSYEMGTIGRSSSRRAWHAEQLIDLARRVNRPLTLLIRGGSVHLPALSLAFNRLISVDTSAHFKAKKRQSASRHHGRLVWGKSPTAPGESIDELLLHNIRVCRRAPREHLPSQANAAVRPE